MVVNVSQQRSTVSLWGERMERQKEIIWPLNNFLWLFVAW